MIWRSWKITLEFVGYRYDKGSQKQIEQPSSAKKIWNLRDVKSICIPFKRLLMAVVNSAERINSAFLKDFQFWLFFVWIFSFQIFVSVLYESES